MPHVVGKTDASTFFGYAYAQAEDYFWQVEDAYILALGRYSEVHGPRGYNSDLLNRAFEIVPRHHDRDVRQGLHGAPARRGARPKYISSQTAESWLTVSATRPFSKRSSVTVPVNRR